MSPGHVPDVPKYLMGFLNRRHGSCFIFYAGAVFVSMDFLIVELPISNTGTYVPVCVTLVSRPSIGTECRYPGRPKFSVHVGYSRKIQEVSRSRSSRSRKYMNLDRPVEPDGSAFCTNIAQGPEISLKLIAHLAH